METPPARGREKPILRREYTGLLNFRLKPPADPPGALPREGEKAVPRGQDRGRNFHNSLSGKEKSRTAASGTGCILVPVV